MTSHAALGLPEWLLWRQRPFPDANLLLLQGPVPALVDSGFVGHAQETADWVHAHTSDLRLVVNTHWHSDHVGANGLLQSHGAVVAASRLDAEAVARRDPGCCAAEYLDQPVAPYTVDESLDDGEAIRLGEADWEVVRTPGHTPGHLCLWQPEEGLLIVGDALSDYDVGWVNFALDGPGVAATALESLQRLADLGPRVVLPSHGRIPEDTGAALDAALRRAQRLVDDPAGAVWYGARRILAFALMIRGGVPSRDVQTYLTERAWLIDAASFLDLTPAALATELVATMLNSGALVVHDGSINAAADHVPADPLSLRVPFPRRW